MDSTTPIARPLIVYSVEGGFTGRMRAITIAADGTAVVELNGARTPTRVDDATRQAIVARLDQSGLFDRDQTFPVAGPGADLQRYEVRYRGATVVAWDTSVPDQLQPALQLLDGTFPR